MRKLLCLAIVLIAVPATAQQPTYTPDQATLAVTLGSANAAATVRLEGRAGASVVITTANLDGTVVPEVSADCTNWATARFLSPAGVPSSSIVFSGGAATETHTIIAEGGMCGARARVSVYNAGTSVGHIRATYISGVHFATQPVSGASDGTQYTEGDVDATITGTALLFEGAGNALVAAPGTAADGLLVNLGGNNDVTVSDGAGALNVIVDSATLGTVTVSDGAGAMNTIVDSGTLTAVTTITNSVTVTDGAGALNVIVDSATLGTVTVSDGAGAMNVIVDSSALPSGAATSALQDGIIKDGAGDTTQANVASGKLSVDPGTVTVTATNLDVQIGGSDTVTVAATNLDVQIGGSDTVTVAATNLDVQIGGSDTVTVTDGAGAMNVIIDSGTVTTVSTLTGTTTLTPGTAATNLGKAEDAVAASGDTGVAILGVRNDAGATTFGADQDYGPIATDANGRVGVADLGGSITVDGTVTVTDGAGALNVIVDSGSVAISADVPGTGATNSGKAEDAVAGSGDTGVMALGVRADTAASTAANGDYVPTLTNARGANWVAIEDGAGGQVTTFGGGTQYTEDAAAAANPTGTAPILVRKDTPSTTVDTDGDNIAQRGTNYGAAYVTVIDTAGAAVTFGSSTEYAEDTASGAADKVIMAGAVRKDTAAALVDTDGDRTELQTDSIGRLRTEITPLPIATSNSDGSCVSVAANTTVLSSFSTRRGATIMAQCDPSACNTDTVFIKLAATATTSDFPLAPGDKFILNGPAVYTGIIDSIANSGTQKVCVLEF